MRAPGETRALGEWLAVPICAFAAARLLLSATAVAVGHPPFDPATWLRGDSGHYL